MPPSWKPRRWLAAAALGAALLVGALPVPAGARGLEREALSPRLAKLASPAVREAPPGRQARALDLPARGPGSLLREGDRVLAEVRLESASRGGLGALRRAGAEVVGVSRRLRTATVLVAPGDLSRLAALPGAEAVTEALAPLTLASSQCPSGQIVSEGDAQLQAGAAREAFGVDGSGVTVGILSDSFDRDAGAVTDAAADVAAGDLPGAASPCANATPVGVLDDSEAEGADEGRAMAQIVHDLAPGAALSFATAFTGELSFAQHIEDLAAAGAEVIADDVIYFDEPFFQDGPVAAAVDGVAGEGVSYFSAAGNENVRIAGKDVGSWQGEFDGTGSCPAGVPHYSAPDQFECTAFDGAGDTGFAITVRGGGSLLIDLQWAEPWYGVGTDVDAYLVDSSGNELASSEYDNPGSTQRPFELLSWQNPKGTARTVQLAIKRYSGTAEPLLKFVLLENGANDIAATEYPESSASAEVGPAIFGHSGAAGAVSVGAIGYASSTAPETYSSRGPVTHLFGPVDGTSPAAALPAPEVLAKPDLVATDCGLTSFFAFEAGGGWRFCGTSAAAPHAAAVAALMREAEPSLSPASVREALTATADPVGAFGPEAVGAGLLDAPGALGEVAEPVVGEPPAEEEPAEEEGEEEPPGEAEGAGEEGAEEGGGSEESGGEASEEPAPAASPATAALSGSAPTQEAAVAPARAAIRTFFRHRPRRLVRTRRRRARVVFVFGTNRPGASFLCRVDSRRPRRCGPRLVHRFRPGRHVVRVRARDAAGDVDRSAAVHRFRVRSRR